MMMKDEGKAKETTLRRFWLGSTILNSNNKLGSVGRERVSNQIFVSPNFYVNVSFLYKWVPMRADLQIRKLN